MLWDEVIGRDVQLSLRLMVLIVTAHIFAVVDEFVVLLVPFVVRADRRFYVLQAVFHIAVIDGYGPFFLQTHWAALSEGSVDFVEPRICSADCHLSPLTIVDAAESVYQLLVLHLYLVLVKERYGPELFSLSDASFGWGMVDAGADVAEAVVVVGFVLEIDEPLRPCQ